MILALKHVLQVFFRRCGLSTGLFCTHPRNKCRRGRVTVGAGVKSIFTTTAPEWSLSGLMILKKNLSIHDTRSFTHMYSLVQVKYADGLSWLPELYRECWDDRSTNTDFSWTGNCTLSWVTAEFARYQRSCPLLGRYGCTSRTRRSSVWSATPRAAVGTKRHVWNKGRNDPWHLPRVRPELPCNSLSARSTYFFPRNFHDGHHNWRRWCSKTSRLTMAKQLIHPAKQLMATGAKMAGETTPTVLSIYMHARDRPRQNQKIRAGL